VQGKAEVVTAQELHKTLSEFAADRIALLHRHEAGARVVSHYDFNNAYQYVINREETQLGWLRSALGEIGAALPGPAAALAMPEPPKPSRKHEAASYASILEDDVRHLTRFVESWSERVKTLTNARHRIMLQVILGESVEHRRLFEQAAAGFEDLLGRRTGGVARVGGVLPTRWVE
jgi:hypothetical protein